MARSSFPLGDHQPILPGFPAHRSNREPRQRKGESWRSYCIRYETWRAVNRPPISREEYKQRVQNNVRRRELYRRKVEVHSYRTIEKAKRKVNCSDPVFFWFGGYVGRPGSQAQYVNRVGLNYLIEHGTLNQGKHFRQGKARIGFGECKG